jgi:large repetitive protein
MATFNYLVNVTGDCSQNSSGIVSILPFGGTPPYTLEWYSPSIPPIDIVDGVASVRTGLPFGTYSVRLNDSTLPVNNEFYLNVPVSSGVCANIVSVSATTCGLNNGSVLLGSSSFYSSTQFYLYSGDGTYITSAVTTNQSTTTIGNLTAGTYYAVALDLGGCSGTSQNFIVNDSSELDFGLYIVPNSTCANIPNGKIFVTGQTGTGPYTYLWNTSATTSSITGLTQGSYSVTVTDSFGCSKSLTGLVNVVVPIGVGAVTSVPPTCFLSNGSVSITVTGGTAPFYYSASTGNVLVSYSTTYSLSGLSSGSYQVLVTDSGLCSVLATATLQTPEGIAQISVVGQSSSCSSNDGSISISLTGGVSPFTYTLIYPDTSQENIITSQTAEIFSNLSLGDYTVIVSDSSACTFSQEVIIIAENKFTTSTVITPTTCGQSNGQITITTSTGATLPIEYSIDDVFKIIDTSLSAVTFNNIPPGPHVVTVTDASGCAQTSNVFVTTSQPLDFSLYSTSCGSGNSGIITAFISTGVPPFTFNWSNNVPNNPQQIQVTGLTAGTYSVIITDSNGCTQNRSTEIDCTTNYVSYQTYVMGEEDFIINSPVKFGLLQMLNEGYADLTSGNTNCTLISATYSVNVYNNPLGYSASTTFYTTTSLNDAPSDNLYYDAVRNLLLSIPGIGSVTINQLTNQITIETIPGDDAVVCGTIVIDIVIVYDIMCLT